MVNRIKTQTTKMIAMENKNEPNEKRYLRFKQYLIHFSNGVSLVVAFAFTYSLSHSCLFPLFPVFRARYVSLSLFRSHSLALLLVLGLLPLLLLLLLLFSWSMLYILSIRLFSRIFKLFRRMLFNMLFQLLSVNAVHSLSFLSLSPLSLPVCRSFVRSFPRRLARFLCHSDVTTLIVAESLCVRSL